ncbi:hypothetical protein [Helicobacter salomonis]|uniref:hypothetical protein n=1 Tax=Helicobacter salomonis TaxID=56878 RepID=UPI001F1EEBA3|nr:hypothetical protein [Helicobacter salomonis]
MPTLLASILMSGLFWGCTPQIIYQKVYVPVKCQVKPPVRPSKELDMLAYLKELLIYTETLEKDLQHCTQSPSKPL